MPGSKYIENKASKAKMLIIKPRLKREKDSPEEPIEKEDIIASKIIATTSWTSKNPIDILP